MESSLHMPQAAAPRPIELLAPAANADIAIEAIRHGADAVYIGPASHGARKSAANTAEDIRRVTEFAHPFGAKVYATVNTIVYEREIQEVERLIRQLYSIGVDALIVQDMGILRMDIPPIAIHASTQCDTRTPEKARFLQEAGFSQIVLARELTLEEIRNIADAVTVPVECFVHGALCVSYSGRCHASQATRGRSANRGECAQICRLPYTLTDADGKVLARDRHLLSLKDFNLSDRLEPLLEAGASSLKIEGRLKDAAYVKNIVSLYRRRLDEIISRHPDRYRRASEGVEKIDFIPQADKSFNRGFTHYFIESRRPADISSPLTPKSLGEEISDIRELHNGDGISFFNARKEYEGVMVNGIKGNRIIGNREFTIPKGSKIHRTLDLQWQKQMARPTATRRLRLDVTLTKSYLKGVDERGVAAIVPLPPELEQARTPKILREAFDKLGNTIYTLGDFNEEGFDRFLPPSQLSEARRRLIDALATAARATYRFDKRRSENRDFPYPSESLDFRDNVANRLAEAFYRDHRVTSIAPAMETAKERPAPGTTVMTTRHCILRETGRCLKHTAASRRDFRLPLHLSSGSTRFTLSFDCDACEMQLHLPEQPPRRESEV